MTPNPEFSSATAQRVMVLEAIERHGGILRSRHGVQARLTSIHGELASSDVTRLLREMEKLGLVALNQVPGTNGGKRITEAMLITVPPNFVAPISKLRSKKNVSGFACAPSPEKDEAPTGQDEVAKLTEEVERAERHTLGRLPTSRSGADAIAAYREAIEQTEMPHSLVDFMQPGMDVAAAKATIELLSDQLRQAITERDRLLAENESLRATVVRQATQLAAQ